MGKKCGKCDGPLVKREDGTRSCSVCDPPFFSKKDATEAPNPSNFPSNNPPSIISSPVADEPSPSPADPPKLNSSPTLDSNESKIPLGQDHDLLPPSSRPIEAPPVLLPPHSRPPAPTIDPPAPATGQPIAPPIEDRTHEPQATDGASSVLDSNISENERVLLPDGKGGFIETSERTTQISYRGAKIALSSMKRDEREASRGLKNFLVVTFCVVFLLVLMVVLIWSQGSPK